MKRYLIHQSMDKPVDLVDVQYVVNPGGQPTAAIVPLALWEALLDAARRGKDRAERSAQLQE